jgi:hypothetical protein
MQQQEQHIELFFSRRQRDFWSAFLGARSPRQAVADASEWSEWFSQLLGTPPVPATLSDADAALRQRLFAACRQVEGEDVAALNAPLTLEEVAAAMDLPTGKAADAHGLTGETLRVAAATPPGSTGGYVCQPLVACVHWLLQRLFDGSPLPDPMCTSKLVPVPKPGQPSAPLDMNNYRGICISAIIGKVWDRLLLRRLDGVVEARGLRAPTQCGFRSGHGTLDAIFTLQHLFHKYTARRQRLYVVFIDFAKAFDLVRRDVLLERCRALGVSGAFMDALVALYDRVHLQVQAGGEVGPAFASHTGTKQGSELS